MVLLYWVIAIPTIFLLVISIVFDWTAFRELLPVLAVWLAAVLVTDLLLIPVWGNVILTMSLPILLAAGMVFPPYAAGALAFVGSLDSREVRRELSLGRALYNRSQVALSVVAASAVFHVLGGSLENWPEVLFVSAAALGTDFLVNGALVAVPTSLVRNLSISAVVRRMHGDSPVEHVAAYCCLGLLAVPLAVTFDAVGPWGLVAFVSPLLLARQMFAHGRRLDEATHVMKAKDRALESSTDRIAKERRDERLVVAGGLHDEVLQPLFKVHLMSQVLRRDLESGRLLDLDTDLPELIESANAAQDAIRNLIHGLRSSSIGPDGLENLLRLLARELGSHTSARIDLEIEDVEGSPAVQLLAYQVAREALNNAARHSDAATIRLRMWREHGFLNVLVEDDGHGFQPHDVDSAAHFGLDILSERVRASGGSTTVKSELGKGTRVLASLPAVDPMDPEMR